MHPVSTVSVKKICQDKKSHLFKERIYSLRDKVWTDHINNTKINRRAIYMTEVDAAAFKRVIHIPGIIDIFT